VHLDAVEYHDAKQGDQLVFMHAVKEGPANRSFGLQVAALAGLPKAVIAEAKQTLAELERGAHNNDSAKVSTQGTASPQSDLFAAPCADPRLEALADALRALDPDAMTPKEALDALYRLKQSGP
jgi:DNA mismatch repair protein MutS